MICILNSYMADGLYYMPPPQKNVQQSARNHQRCFHIQHASTPVFKNSFFPRTIREWNNLDSSVVSAGTVGEFKTLLQHPPKENRHRQPPPPPTPPHFSSNPPLSPSLTLFSCSPCRGVASRQCTLNVHWLARPPNIGT